MKEPAKNELHIIGDGLIGSALKKCSASFKIPWMIIAAGVSDSKCDALDQYRREENLITDCIETASMNSQRILYISTYSVNDKTLSTSPYVRNKLHCEKRIMESSRSNVVLRLTNVVGRNGNPANILNFLVYCIRDNAPFAIWKGAHRNFLDIDDVVRFTLSLKKSDTGIIELVHPENYEVSEVVRIIEKALNKEGHGSEVTSPTNTIQSNQRSIQFFKSSNLGETDYLKNLIFKYYA